MDKSKLSDVGRSNLFTMGISAEKDPRQKVPDSPQIPSEEVRLLRARLILEEALETIAGLGFQVDVPEPGAILTIDDFQFVVEMDEKPAEPNMEEIIDGCCDTIYVCVGTLLACGVPDLPHLAEVCRANNSKFPKGVAILDENGKYQKPPGWRPPDHIAVIAGTVVKEDQREIEEKPRLCCWQCKSEMIRKSSMMKDAWLCQMCGAITKEDGTAPEKSIATK